MIKTMCLLVCLTVTSVCMGQGNVDYSGIWQDQRTGDYLTINQNADRLILVNLPAIERGASVLHASYTGSTRDSVLERVVPLVPAVDIFNRMTILYRSPTELVVFPICETCAVVGMELKKIF